jgi:hypothetical protein
VVRARQPSEPPFGAPAEFGEILDGSWLVLFKLGRISLVAHESSPRNEAVRGRGTDQSTLLRHDRRTTRTSRVLATVLATHALVPCPSTLHYVGKGLDKSCAGDRWAKGGRFSWVYFGAMVKEVSVVMAFIFRFSSPADLFSISKTAIDNSWENQSPQRHASKDTW